MFGATPSAENETDGKAYKHNELPFLLPDKIKVHLFHCSRLYKEVFPFLLCLIYIFVPKKYSDLDPHRLYADPDPG